LLRVNTNTYNPADPYWSLPDGTGNKHLEANFYVDAGTTLGGQDVTFVGTVESNSLPAGWTCDAVIKEFAPGYAYIGLTRVPIVGGEAFSVNRTIGAGNIAQYGFITYGPNAAPDSAAAQQAASIIVDNEDPSITGAPSGQRVLVGGTASFSVLATGGTPLSYQWKRYGTNLVNAPGKIAGATSATLTISNAQAADDTTYTVTVTDTAGSLTPPAARLRVLTAAQYANCLDNPSFEEDYLTYGVVPDPWVNFTGSALLSSGDFPWAAPVEGTNVVQIFNAGAYNGIYQDVSAAPGDIFTGDCSIFQSSFDALTAPLNQAYLEVQFRHGNDAPIAIYNSIFITNSASMQDAWLKLYATNGVAAGYAQTSTTNSNYLVAPAGTDHVRYQVTLHAEGAGSGSVYVDVMHLMKKIPVTVTSTINGANIELSWLSQGATDYQVVYKNNLTDASWTPVGGVVAGDGTTKTASFPAGVDQRFYSVLTK
ncbi:MAG: immunoglobulin domain-containing protein, partial [Verrucomicrobiota bacterium]